jgi:hypothetical protein
MERKMRAILLAQQTVNNDLDDKLREIEVYKPYFKIYKGGHINVDYHFQIYFVRGMEIINTPTKLSTINMIYFVTSIPATGLFVKIVDHFHMNPNTYQIRFSFEKTTIILHTGDRASTISFGNIVTLVDKEHSFSLMKIIYEEYKFSITETQPATYQ